VTRGFPGGAEERKGLGGQGDVPVLGALPTMDLDLEARAINVGDLQAEGFMEPEAQARDGGKGDLVVPGCGRREESLDLLHTEDGWQTVGGVRTQEWEGVPIAREDGLGEEAETTVAEAQGRGGKAVNVFAVQEIALQLLFSNAVGWLVVELREQASFPDIGFLSPCAFATEVEGRQHVLTQWGHEISPFLWWRVVGMRRKIA
jgi:hypothetical protein